LKYLNESQKQVVLAEKALKVILDTVTSASWAVWQNVTCGMSVELS
jgi:hypothetical protein